MQLVVENPAIWVICDSQGNWARIQYRLKTQNLKFEGSKVHIYGTFLKNLLNYHFISPC